MELENVWVCRRAVEVNVAAHTDTDTQMHMCTYSYTQASALRSRQIKWTSTTSAKTEIMVGWVCTGLWTHYPQHQLPVHRLAEKMTDPGCTWPTALPFVHALPLSGQTEGMRTIRPPPSLRIWVFHAQESPAAGPLLLPAVSVSLGEEWVVKRTCSLGFREPRTHREQETFFSDPFSPSCSND